MHESLGASPLPPPPQPGAGAFTVLSRFLLDVEDAGHPLPIVVCQAMVTIGEALAKAEKWGG